MSESHVTEARLGIEEAENEEETQLFDSIAAEAMAQEKLASVIDEYELEDRLKDQFQSDRSKIWDQVRVQRSRRRAAVAAFQEVSETLLPEYEEAIRESRPDLVAGLADIERARVKLKATEAKVEQAIEELQLERQRDAAAQQSRRNRAMVQRVEEIVRQAESETANPESVGKVPRKRRLRIIARWRGSKSTASGQTESAVEPPSDAAARIEQKIHEATRSLQDVRTQISRMDLMRDRVDATISQGARRSASENQAMRDAQTEATSAQATLEEALVEAILQAIRSFLNLYASQTFNVHMRVREAGGLFESVSGNVVTTAAIESLYETICRMSGVSIGLAGPRGAGKSTAIQYLHEKLRSVQADPQKPTPAPDWGRRLEGGDDLAVIGEPRRTPPGVVRPRFFTLVVSAPVTYIPRDFILHVFAELCRAIAGPQADELISPAAAQQPEEGAWNKRDLIAPVLSFAFLIAAAVAAVAATAVAPTNIRLPVLLIAASSACTAEFAGIIQWLDRALGRDRSSAGRITIGRQRLLTVFVLTNIFAVLAVTGIAFLPETLGRIFWITGICLFVISATTLPGWETQDTERPRRRSLRALIRAAKDRFWLLFEGITLPGLTATAAGATALVSLVLRPRSELFLFAGCALLIIAAAVLGCFRELIWRERLTLERASQAQGRALSRPDRPPPIAPAAREASWHTGHRVAMSAFCIVAAAGLGSVTAGYAWPAWKVSVAGMVALLLGTIAIIAGVILTRASLVSRQYQPQTDIPYWPADQFSPPAEISDLVEQGVSLVDKALEYLYGIRFQQTFSLDRTHGWTVTGPSALPLSFQAQRKLGTSLSSDPRSLPELVAQFKDFVAIILRHGFRVLVAIDELDKLEVSEAQTFLNDIKAIFGAHGCNFLVSLSEDAAADFERRGVPLRSAFDSAFDDVVSIGYFTYQTSADVLQKRVTGLSEPFIMLCHVLAGGLARDLVRIARAMVQVANAERETLAESTLRLCSMELASKMGGICWQLARMDGDPWAADLLATLISAEGTLEDAGRHFALADYVDSWMTEARGQLSAEKDSQLPRVLQRANEIATFARFTGTVCKFFSEHITEERAEEAVSGFKDRHSLERLAVARQAMSISISRANVYIADFLDAWALETKHAEAPNNGGNALDLSAKLANSDASVADL